MAGFGRLTVLPPTLVAELIAPATTTMASSATTSDIPAATTADADGTATAAPIDVDGLEVISAANGLQVPEAQPQPVATANGAEDNAEQRFVQLESVTIGLASRQSKMEEMMTQLTAGMQQLLVQSTATASPPPPSPSPPSAPSAGVTQLMAPAPSPAQLTPQPQAPQLPEATATASTAAKGSPFGGAGLTAGVKASSSADNPSRSFGSSLAEAAPQVAAQLQQSTGIEPPASLTSATTHAVNTSKVQELRQQAAELELQAEKLQKEEQEQQLIQKKQDNWKQLWKDEGYTSDDIDNWNKKHPWDWKKTTQEVTVIPDIDQPGSKPASVIDRAELTTANVGDKSIQLVTVPLKDFLKTTSGTANTLGTGSSYDSGQKLGWVKIPAWDGRQATLPQYKLDIKTVVMNINRSELPKLAGRMIAEFTDAAKRYLHVEPELIGNELFNTDDGYQLLIDHMSAKLGITSRQEENSKFRSYFYEVRRQPGESFLSYDNKEELAYRELQKSISRANAADTLGTDSTGKPITWFLPDNLRGWFYLERSGLSQEKKMQLILQCSGSTSLVKLKDLIRETYTPAAIIAMDKANRNHWQDHSGVEGNYYGMADDDYDDWDQDNTGYYDCIEDEEDIDNDPFMDEDGCMVATTGDIDRMNQGIAAEDEEFAKALLNFTEARDILKKLQVARNFFPVVVPAQYFPEAKKGAMGKGKGRKGKGKGKRTGKGKGNKGKSPGDKRKGAGPGRGRGNPRRSPPSANNKPPFNKSSDKEPLLCFKCGKPGHLMAECPDKDIVGAKRQRVNVGVDDDGSSYPDDQWYEDDYSYDAGYVAYDLGQLPTDDENLFCGQCIDNSQPTLRYECCQFDHRVNQDYSYDKQRTNDQHEDKALATFSRDHEGYAIVDTGCTIGCAGGKSLERLWLQVRDEEERNIIDHHEIQQSQVNFGTAGGNSRAELQATLRPDTSGPLQGPYNVQVLPAATDCPILLGMDYLRSKRAVIDCELGTMVYKDEPDTVHRLKRANNGLLMIPLTASGMTSYHAVIDPDSPQVKELTHYVEKLSSASR